MKKMFLIALLAASPALHAETPQQILAPYAAEAARQYPGYQPSAQRGESFFRKRFGISSELPDCATCHTDNPKAQGRHAITGKPIDPLAPSANPERFSDPKKVEKWFRRNCKEVLGRECVAHEKADFIQFLIQR